MIKKFGNFLINESFEIPSSYYTIHINGSWDKFIFALTKLGYYEEFLSDWSIEDFDDLLADNKEYFLHDLIILLIKGDDSSGYAFLVRHNLEELHWYVIDKSINKGDIYVEDHEVSAKKYNL